VGLAVMCFFASATVFSVFGLAACALAILRKEYLWAVGILVVNVLSVPYIWFKAREMK
jgi:hypothetical protein